MKILVWGAGVIGSYLVHILCSAGNDVTLLARGKRREELEQNGLLIRHYLQKKNSADYPHIAEQLNKEEYYDAVFAVMQYQQMWPILDGLAACASPMIVLVGNNPSASEMEQYIKERCTAPKKILFAFQATGGRREGGKTICVRFGAAGLTCGLLHGEPDEETKAGLAKIFSGTKYKPAYTSDMDAWYKCHLALVLPGAYLCYLNGCNLKKASQYQLRQMMAAVREGYGLLQALGYPILPKGSERYFESGPKKLFIHILLFIIAKTTLGRLAASDHCRNALTEMQKLNAAFEALRAQKPDFPMPVWNEMEQHLPQGEVMHIG